MSDEPSFYKRQFLNNDERGGIALIEARVDEPSDKGYFDAVLRIGDCNRIVELNFDCYGAEQVEEGGSVRLSMPLGADTALEIVLIGPTTPADCEVVQKCFALFLKTATREAQRRAAVGQGSLSIKANGS